VYWLIINNFESFFYMRSGQWVFSVFLGAIYSVALHRELKGFAKERYENLRR
jgi:O-antigen ligase